MREPISPSLGWARIVGGLLLIGIAVGVFNVAQDLAAIQQSLGGDGINDLHMYAFGILLIGALVAYGGLIDQLDYRAWRREQQEAAQADL